MKIRFELHEDRLSDNQEKVDLVFYKGITNEEVINFIKNQETVAATNSADFYEPSAKVKVVKNLCNENGPVFTDYKNEGGKESFKLDGYEMPFDNPDNPENYYWFLVRAILPIMKRRG